MCSGGCRKGVSHRTAPYYKETTMRGNQEAYILVKVKDGRKFVCAINKLKATKKNGATGEYSATINLEKDVIWQ